MNILGDGRLDDAWKDGNQNGREEALKEVLERIENDLKVLSVAENHAPLHPHAIGSRKYANELKAWLTKQLNEST